MLGRLFGCRKSGGDRGATFMGRLARDTRGNVIAIVGASILPMLALIGSGIDVSRAYMAQARLQLACDAASLAGRRAMSNGVVDTAVTDEATKFFNFNFPQGLFKTAAFTPAVTGAANSTVVVTASTTVPTTIMKFFGFSQLPISATCNARQDFVNTDILLVLDTTGSMGYDVNGVNVNSGSTSKIVAMRTAVLALYDELKPVQDQLEAAGLRMRFGIVPFASGLNVGKLLYAKNASFIESDKHNYYSRAANYNILVYAPNTPTTTATNETYGSDITSANCTLWGSNAVPYGLGTPINSSSTPPADNTQTSYAKVSWTKKSGNGSSAVGTCIRSVTVKTTSYAARYKASSGSAWISQRAEYQVGNLVNGAGIDVATNTGGTVATAGIYNAVQIPTVAQNVTLHSSYSYSTLTKSTTQWNGCIEERDTVPTITSTSGYGIPSGAYDLEINLLPSSAATRWRPYWPDVEAKGDGAKASATCPGEARRLQVWTRDALSAYLNSLSAAGSTYHDFGMIWGARFLSPGGVFASDNPDTYNNMPVSRHVIFMTDGIMDTDPDVYSLYGQERLDKRTSGGYVSETDQNSRHNQRFKIACNATKGIGASIWVVAFASSLTAPLSECASNSNQASTSADSAALIAKFVEIGKNIGALRLSQ